jgi:20S proteasome alpha/beta subunit
MHLKCFDQIIWLYGIGREIPQLHNTKLSFFKDRHILMTITVSILVPSGIVLAADSRQVTETRVSQLRIDSDNAQKIIQLSPRLAVILNGQGTFYSNRSESPQAIGDILRVAAIHLPKNSTVKNSSVFLHQTATDVLKTHLSVTKLEQASVSFYVAGYSPTKNIGELYRCNVPGEIALERRTDDAGAVWNGERAIVNRLIQGYDPKLFESLAPIIGEEQSEKLGPILRGLQLYINFQTMPLQDVGRHDY